MSSFRDVDNETLIFSRSDYVLATDAGDDK